MKKILFSLIILWPGFNNASFAQSNDQSTGLREKSVLFFVNNLHWISKGNDHIITEFKSHNNKNITYRYTNSELDLTEKLYGTKNANPDWKSHEDGYFSVGKKFNSGYSVSLISDSLQATKSPFDISIDVSDVMGDAEYDYVFLNFRSDGNLAIFYEGEVVCKFDKKGNLVKYSYIER